MHHRVPFSWDRLATAVEGGPESGPHSHAFRQLGQIQDALRELGAHGDVTYREQRRVEQIEPKVFAKVRELAGVDAKYLDEIDKPLSVAPHNCHNTWASYSGLFWVEPLRAAEAAFLRLIAGRYLQHLVDNPNSLIVRIVGLYSIESTPGGDCVHVAILKAVLPLGSNRLDYLYSLRGVDSFVKRTGALGQVLHDENFVQEQQVIMLPKEVHQRVCDALHADTLFLREIEAVGYSFMLGICKVTRRDTTMTDSTDHSAESQLDDGIMGWRLNQEPVVYYLGIVQVFQRWTIEDVATYILKKVITQPLVIQPPEQYARRFKTFLEGRVLAVDGDEAQNALSTTTRRQDRRTHARLQEPGARGDRFGEVSTASLNTLAVLAAVESAERHAPVTESWCAMVDALDAGKGALQLWHGLGLIDEGAYRDVDFKRAALSRMRLPPCIVPENDIDVANDGPAGVALSKIHKLIKATDRMVAAGRIGGNLMADNSSQYSLALAIAVGVEAATRCSSRIAERFAVQFYKHPVLKRRPAAKLAKRTYFLPEEGSWLSPPHMLPDLHFVEHAPELFKEIREAAGFKDMREYIHCVCQRDFSFIEFKSNSKSGQFFFFTHDGRCMVKTISEKEADTLVQMLRSGYIEHLESPEGSLLTRMYGLYQVQLPWFNGGRPQYFTVQENCLYSVGSHLLERFDLKGSTDGRFARPGESIQKDQEWIQKEYRFNFDAATAERIQRLHQRDCEFLARCGVIDYSLIVAICGKDRSKTSQPQVKKGPGVPMILCRPPALLWELMRQEVTGRNDPHGPFEASNDVWYYIGIIDFLITWDMKKKAEYLWRQINCKAEVASVNPPERYAKRQINFVKSIL